MCTKHLSFNIHNELVEPFVMKQDRLLHFFCPIQMEYCEVGDFLYDLYKIVYIVYKLLVPLYSYVSLKIWYVKMDISCENSI